MVNKKTTIFFIFGALLLCGLIYTNAFAQVGALFDDVTLEWLPAVPKPHDTIYAKLTSYSIDINSSYITWVVNGVKIKEGLGNKTAFFAAGDAGSKISINATIITQDGMEFHRSAEFTIGDVDLLWHTATYVPPFYKGKALASYKSRVTVTAVPALYQNGKKIPADQLVYKWKLDGKSYPERSGFNKQSFNFSIDGIVRRNQTVEVTVYNLGNNVQAIKNITLSPQNTEILFYENSPLEGPKYNQAVNNFSIFSGEETQFMAVPYNFSVASPEKLLYNWQVNGEKETEKAPQNYLFNFRSMAGAIGDLLVSLQVLNSDNAFQQNSASFSIKVE